MRPGALLVNTARGAVVDVDAVLAGAAVTAGSAARRSTCCRTEPPPAAPGRAEPDRHAARGVLQPERRRSGRTGSCVARVREVLGA